MSTNIPPAVDPATRLREAEDALLQEFISIEAHPSADLRVRNIQLEMRTAINAILQSENVTDTGDDPGLHHPAGNEIVALREDIDLKQFQSTVGNMLNRDVSVVNEGGQKKIFGVLQKHTTALKNDAKEMVVPAPDTQNVDATGADSGQADEGNGIAFYKKWIFEKPALLGKKAVGLIPAIGKGFIDWAKGNLSVDNMNVFSNDFWLYALFSKKKK